MRRKQLMIKGKRWDVWERPVDPDSQAEVLEAKLVFLPEEERTYVEGRTSNIHS